MQQQNRPQSGVPPEMGVQQRRQSVQNRKAANSSLGRNQPSQQRPSQRGTSGRQIPQIKRLAQNGIAGIGGLQGTNIGPQNQYAMANQRIASNTSHIESQQSSERAPTQMMSNSNRFRIAIPPQQQPDVSGKYWNQISNQINVDKVFLQQKLQSQRFQPMGGTSTNLQLDSARTRQSAALVGQNFGQGKGLSNISSEKDIRQATYTPTIIGNIPRNEFDQLQRPFSFLANVGGKETSQQMFTTKIDKGLLKNQDKPSKSVNKGQKKEGDTTATDFVTFNQQASVQNEKVLGTSKVITDPAAGVTIFTDMNVDKHDFDIKQRREIQRATSATHRPQSTFRSQKSLPASAMRIHKDQHGNQQQTLQPQIMLQAHLNRPISGIIPQTMSHKILANQVNLQNPPNLQTIIPLPSQGQKQKDFKISKRPFSANPKYLQLSGLNRPFSAQLKMGSVQKHHNNIETEELDDEDDYDEEEEEEYVDLNIYEVPEEDRFGARNNETESFSQRIMNSRPTTAYKKDKNFDLPYPELFDRSERTFAATFAKYGDLSYYTPIQRIGSYMDFSARLKKRHILDLIAYMRTSKKPIKPTDEEQNEAEQAQKDYEENTLFIGVMPEEDNPKAISSTLEQSRIDRMDEQREIEEARVRVYDPSDLKFEGNFQYQKLWSETLKSQVQLSQHRFMKYLESGEAIKNEEISKFKKEWMSKALDLIPDTLLNRYANEVRKLFSEVFSSYSRAMKQAILEYILRSPEERKRLHIMMLPRPIPTASEKQLMRGGYSIVKFTGEHQRKLDAENEIKLRLLNNNVVISALQNWWKDFRSFNLLEFRNLYQLVEGDQGLPGTACYAMDIDSFFAFQESHRQKIYQLFKYIWHRGAILIIKKFKFLRLREQHQLQEHGKMCKSKWTFGGYKPFIDPSLRDEISELKWEQIEKFERNPFGKQTLMQRYFTRTASVHQNVHLNYFMVEDGMEMGAIPEAYRDELELEDLVDVRENSAYIAFVSMIGGYINFEENGYDILAKEYKRELKYSAGNLMRLQLREFVDKSVDTFLNFFKGFPTIDKIKVQVSNPLRKIRIFVTQTRKSAKDIEAEQKQKEEEEKAKILAMKKAGNKASSKRVISEVQKTPIKEETYFFDKEPTLVVPDYFDYQDFMNPVFRLDLTLSSGSDLRNLSQSQVSGFGIGNSVHNGDTLEFTKKEADIIDEFELHFMRLVTTFNEFTRPEFSKVKVLSKKRYEGDLEEDARLKKLNIQIKKQTGMGAGKTTSVQNSFIGAGGSNANMSSSHAAGFQGVMGQKARDFDQILYKGHEDGQDVYRKYLGRIQITESEKATKDIIDENNLGIFTKQYIEKPLKIADPDEVHYQEIKHKIRKILIKHLRESKRVIEVFSQFDSIIKGTLQQRVKDFIQEEKTERQYELLIKELRYFQKLSMQLPTIVFFPMFEIGTTVIKDEIQRRIKNLLTIVFRKFESSLIIRSQGICDKYTQICKFLDKLLKTPHDVVEMERYKNNLLLEMGNLQEKMYENRKSVFFLLHNDKMFEDETWTLIKELHEWPARLNNHMDECDDRHRNERNVIESMVIRKREYFETSMAVLDDQIKEVQSWGELSGYRIVIGKVLEYQNQIDQFEEQMLEISSEEMMLFGFKSPFETYHKVKKFFTPFYELWTNVNDIMMKKRQWLDSQLANIDPDEVDAMIKQSIKGLQKLQKNLSENQLAQKVINQLGVEIADLNDWLPTIEVLCNPCLKHRHWQQIQSITKENFNYKEISLNGVKYFNIKVYLDQLAEVSERAKKENRLEKMLDKMENEWKDLRFELTTFRDTGIPILQGQNVEEIQLLLDEHTLTAQTIRSSPDVAPMVDRATNWERLMVFQQEVLDVWVKVQANYLYLEPIFHSEDITKKLPTEANEFAKIDKMWRDAMNKVQQDTLVLHLNKIKNIQTNLEDANHALDRIQKSLNEYLETKRQYFPRFYFLSNEDLLEILGDSKKPAKVQRHLKKCFEGVNQVIFKQSVNKDMQSEEGDDEIVAIVSRENERVELIKTIYPYEYKGNVEQWLLELENQMKASIQHVISESMTDYIRNIKSDGKRQIWISNWQGQIVLTVSQIMWTRQIESAMKSGGIRDMKEYFKKCQAQLDEIVSLVRNDLPPLMRMSLGSLIVLDVHAKDTLEGLIDEGISSVDDFSWLAQLRYYFINMEKHVLVKMITTTQDYGYEYLGNTGRLVITPLTDRCYRTLMSALHLNLGGAPEGPAGTGKTESTKDLAKAIAVHCMVFNCAEGLNASAMAKFFKGLASAGSWSCFDEFNRIELEVLSVVAQQILEIQRAKNQQKEIFFFEGVDIVLKKSCNVFITMNPGYAGRSELPDNLKALFRPVAMMMPDYTMIAEISLYSFGFLESRNLAKKIVATYRLCSEQLSSQYHYDYGMRAVKAVLTAAKGLKQKYPEEREDVLILRSINDVNLPKFLAHDIPLFKGITEDLFQGISLHDINYGSLDVCIKKVVKEFNLQEIQSFMQSNYYNNANYSDKVFQLYEMINCRHGLMLVGPPFGAKTMCYKVLAKALTQVTKDDPKYGELPVDTYVINPKSITLSQLYGSFDPISQDFTDGILGQIFRRCAYKDMGKSRRWIVFDGPVDAEWIENMNTVLDDNKKLCLLNGEVIMMNDQMNLIFEAHDLSQASPATVSRCGMVYMQPENIGWLSLQQSWMNILLQKTKGGSGESLDPSYVRRIEDLFEIFFPQAYQFLRKKCTTYVPVSEVQLASSLMKIYQALLVNPIFLDMCYNPKIKNDDVVNRIDMYFLYSLMWSVGAVSDEAGSRNFSNFLRKICLEVYRVRQNKTTLKIDKQSQIPDGGTIIQNYFIEEHRWICWKDVLERNDNNKEFDPSLTYHELIVPTTENLKNSYALNLFLKNNIPTLFIGPTGTGKSVLVQKYLRQLPYEYYTTVFISFSAKTSANQTQDIIDSKLEKRGRRIMGPPLGKKCVIFVDDLNMPALEKYGAQPPIELLRQWMDHKGWYELKEKEKQFKELIDLIFISAMGPPGGGKNPITPRYLRHFNLISINNFEENVLCRIFSKLMDWHVKRCGISPASDVYRTLQGVVNGSVDVFLFAQQELRPTPAKSHYLFNLRDLSRIIQGIQMCKREELTDSKKVLRLWVHEIGRVFSDRLINEEDQLTLYNKLFISAREKIKEDLISALKNGIDERKHKIEGNKDVMVKHLLFGDVLGEGISTHDRKYDEINLGQRGMLTERMNGYLEDYNSVSKKPMNLVLFDFAIMHVLRICRILRMASGNAFLIGVGGSGRQSLSKLATFICDYGIVETEQSKNYNIDIWKEDMKRLLLLAGQDSKNSVFLLTDTQIKFSFMLEDINNLLNAGEIPNLFAADERLQIMEKLRPLAKKEGRMNLYNNGTNEQFNDYFVEKTKQHLHVILAMSPIGNTLRERIRNFPSLVNCCTFDWFTTWPEDALEAVAERFLQEGDIEENERQSIIKLCKKIHTDMINLSKRYLTEQKRYNYVTPTSYLELILTYKELLRKQRQKTLTLKLGYDKGIEKLLFTAEEVYKMQQDLNEKQPKLAQMTVETEILMQKIEKESREIVAPKKIQIEEEEGIANQMAQEAQTIKIECDNDLSKAMPLVKKAQEALNTIQPSHINEVKSLGKPPDPIKKVLHAVCIMCQRKVEKTPKKDNPKELEENWWYTAQKFMSEKNFMDSLLEYDKDHIPDLVMNKIRANFLNDPDFKPQRVEKASFAAKGLCMWIRALDQYDKVAKIIAPKRQRAKEAEAKYKETLDQLKKKQAELRDILEQFEMLQAQLEETKRKKKRLEDDIEDCARKLDRAQTLLHGLGGEQKRWEEATVQLGIKYDNLIGDTLISAAIISYLGAFTGIYRNETIKHWINDIKSLRINASQKYSFLGILGEPVTIRHWNLNGLPTDNFSVDNGIVVFNSRRWPLMIDPQGQANRWIKNLELSDIGASNKGTKLQIVKLSDPDLVRVFEQSIQLGFPVVLENVGEELDPILEPLLMKQTFKSAGVVSINFGDNIIEYSNDFRLYITTKYANPHYLPELSTKVAVINFMITFDGLKDYLLNLVVQKENAALDDERQKLIIQTYENNKQLKDIENKILDVLRTSQGNILDDEKAIDILKQSQELSNHIKEKQEVALVTEKKLEEARKLYLPIAQHSSLLFFIIQKLSQVDVMYQYSLTWFIQLFLMAIENSEKSEFIEQRIESLKNYFTYSIYSNVCRSLFEKHKLLFSFILTAKLKESERKVSTAQYEFLISTLPGLENPLDLDNPAEDWMPNAVWNKVCELSTIEYRFQGLIKHFQKNVNQWKKIYESNYPHKEDFPQLDDGLTLETFQKLCILKVFRPDKLVPLIKEYVIQEMGEQFVNPPPFDLELSFNDSTFQTPLIFVLPGADPLQSLTAFAQSKKKLDTMKSISLGQDQGPKAEKAIEEAKLKGGWVLLQNCHLYPSWMPKLERICETLDMKIGGKDVAHPAFRLWLTSYPSNDFPILILQNGIKMTNEPPKGLKANMIGSYKMEPISDQNFFNIHSKLPTFKKLLYGLCMFHAIIQERRNYGSLGWNIRYEFTVSDLSISVKQLQLFTNEYIEVPFKALKYLTGECNYGGRVTDDRDRRVLKALLEDFYKPELLNENFYPFGIETYEIPHGNVHYSKYLEHIQKLPLEEPPSLFGFHPNANITKELKETSELCYDLLKMGEIEGVKAIAHEIQRQNDANFSSINSAGSQGSSQKLQRMGTKKDDNKEKQSAIEVQKTPEQIIEKICKDILQKLPQQLFDIEAVQQKYPLVRENSMNTFLVQELTRFNNLLKTITTSLKNILLALKGEVLLSEQLEKVFNSLLLGDIPQMWLQQSYPSMKNVASYIKDFCLRLQTYQNWINNGSPKIFWISGFFFTQSFLTGVFQNYARKYKLEIDTLVYDFDFLTEDPTDYENEVYENKNTPKIETPEDGALISGLFMEGARWDYQGGHLEESQPKILFSKVPIIWLKPTKVSKMKENECYECPLYKTAERKGVLSTTGHSTNFIINVRTPMGGISESTHWIKRGVAMICQLSN